MGRSDNLAAIGNSYNFNSQRSRRSDWGQGMSWLLRVCSCLLLAFQAFALLCYPATSQELAYAAVVPTSRVIEVLHCPTCSVELMEIAKRYYVRTAQGLNVRFTLEPDAWHAARLLNTMIEASDRCEADTYRVALEQYVETVEMQIGETVAIKGRLSFILDPHADGYSTAMYAVPAYHGCRSHAVAKAQGRLTHVAHVKMKWARHRHGPLASLR
jgi:hypothetical protein